MRFTVVWIPHAEEELGRTWLRAEDREAVSRAAYQIDRQLRDDLSDKENHGPRD